MAMSWARNPQGGAVSGALEDALTGVFSFGQFDVELGSQDLVILRGVMAFAPTEVVDEVSAMIAAIQECGSIFVRQWSRPEKDS